MLLKLKTFGAFYNETLLNANNQFIHEKKKLFYLPFFLVCFANITSFIK